VDILKRVILMHRSLDVVFNMIDFVIKKDVNKIVQEVLYSEIEFRLIKTLDSSG
jgi:hypothetical protein